MCFGRRKATRKVKVPDYEFEEIDGFKYIEVTLWNNGIKSNKSWGKDTDHKQSLLPNKKTLLNKDVLDHNMVRYNTCGGKNVDAVKETKKLLIYERKIVRKILTPLKADQGMRIKETNAAIEKGTKGENIVKFIKTQNMVEGTKHE